jgi:prevent-host-death family protein
MPRWKPTAKIWQLQEAKAKFSEVCDRAASEGPQYVTRRGKEEFVVAKRSDFECGQAPTHILDILLAAPTVPEFKIHRSGSTGRKPPEFN